MNGKPQIESRATPVPGPARSIILFLCSWGPHAAFQRLQDECAPIPEAVKMVRIPCTGRITKALLFKPFEMGADGVALIGCHEGTCRYGSGTNAARANVRDTCEILDLLGLGATRLRLGLFLPDDSAGLLQFLRQFSDDIQSLDKSPVASNPLPAAQGDPTPALNQVLREYDVYACQDCGKCSSACPLTLAGKTFSPRSTANALIAGQWDDEGVRRDIWSCLTCGLCSDRCPSAVNFPGFVREVRRILLAHGLGGHEAHGGFFQSLSRTMTSPELRIRHWSWLPDDIQTDPQSKVLFFGGCAPYFDIFFRTHLGVTTRDILVDSLRLLNFFDIHPALLDAERCCGHDLYWSGDQENFLKLARLNVEAIRASGVEEVIVCCPEGYRTFSHDYPANGVETPFKVTLLMDFLEREIDKGAVGFKRLNRSLTFQDPCRLSRFEKKSALPRKLIGRLDSAGFGEMQEHGVGAICCGNTAWTGCDAFSKALQVHRLRQARATGADLLVTACPKCQIHLRCAMQDPFIGESLEMETVDLTTLLARTIRWE